jgi:hypothetical protein
MQAHTSALYARAVDVGPYICSVCQGCGCRPQRETRENVENIAVYYVLFDGFRSCFYNGEWPLGKMRRRRRERRGTENKGEKVRQGQSERGCRGERARDRLLEREDRGKEIAGD